MSPINWLNRLLRMENVLGIYRNYCTRKKSEKYLIICQIFIQTILHIVLVIYEMYLLLKKGNYGLIKSMFGFFGVLACLNSASSVVTGSCYSSDFMAYYRSITCVYERFKGDRKLITSLMIIFCVSIVLNCAFYALLSFKTSEGLFIFLPSDSKLLLVPILISQAIVRYTIAFEHLMLHIVVMLVVRLFKCLTSLISAVQESVRSCESNSDECGITREQIQCWVELYRDLANCCEKLSLCFGRQYSLSLVLSIPQYVFLIYQMVNMKITNIGESFNSSRIGMIVLSYITVLMMPLIAGQMIKNQGVKFHRALARLHNTTIIDLGEVEAKLIKDFIRLIKKNPLEIKLVAKVPVGMYIMPVVFTLTINYLIIILQINHII